MDGLTVSPLDLSRTLLVGGGLLVPYSLSRIFCHKTTHADGYYGAWPGWAVSISVLPLTEVLAEAKGTWNWMVKADLCDNPFMQWLATKGKFRCSILWYFLKTFSH